MSKKINARVIKFDNIEEAKSYIKGKYTSKSLEFIHLDDNGNEVSFDLDGIYIYGVTFNDFNEFSLSAKSILYSTVDISDESISHLNISNMDSAALCGIGAMNIDKDVLIKTGKIVIQSDNYRHLTLLSTSSDIGKSIEILIVIFDISKVPDWMARYMAIQIKQK